jgi:hypothetical protein
MNRSPVIDTPTEIHPNAVAVAMVPTQIVTMNAPYDTRRTKSAYWNQLKTAFRLVNGNGEGVEYSICKSTHGHIIIRRNNDTISNG